ncbi:uncharacterized protein LOC120372068 isoform X2 [Mauremys reevesii]|uniref:uncharacterized protein LOC120372068 isoform X2 n=1 Tax=Mauremys reevesii TaxID=260615 RepID=UPI00194006C8|nr:uncharacterized protein LOC120372068 isoform X2 [Mauremys reevesii]
MRSVGCRGARTRRAGPGRLPGGYSTRTGRCRRGPERERSLRRVRSPPADPRCGLQGNPLHTGRVPLPVVAAGINTQLQVDHLLTTNHDQESSKFSCKAAS